MNDVYVGLVIVAAYIAVRRALARASAARAGAFWLADARRSACFLGLALASKWVAAVRDRRRSGILVLVRSALGRLLADRRRWSRLTGVLGYIAITVPAGGRASATCRSSLIMVVLTLVGGRRQRAPPDRLVARGAAVRGRRAGGARRPRRPRRDRARQGGRAGRASARSLVTPLELAVLRSSSLGRRLRGVRRSRAGSASARCAAPAPDDPAALLAPPAPPPPRLAAARRRPRPAVVWLVVCLLVDPARRLRRSRTSRGRSSRTTSSSPAGRPATPARRSSTSPEQMYDYHNNLTAPHAGVVAVVGVAVRPQAGLVLPGGLRRPTTASIYDAGNLVVWWLGIPALAFVPGRRSSGGASPLALIAIGFAVPVDLLGAHRPGRVPVPLLHEPAVPVPGPRLLPGRAVARAVAPDVAAGPAGGRPSRSWARLCCGCFAGRCAGRRRDAGQPGLAGLPDGHPATRR